MGPVVSTSRKAPGSLPTRVLLTEAEGAFFHPVTKYRAACSVAPATAVATECRHVRVSGENGNDYRGLPDNRIGRVF
jgi:hypothetical protein